ncbi:DUF4916 domain-containing protein [Paenibacillus validus]|uniref:DUF4916 domain-containing protein n=1 Tax=Paenibacillus validus TaxID=44253 RepID=UPI003D28E626
MSNWLESRIWEDIQKRLPIICVDVIPIQLNKEGHQESIGLIFRETPHQGNKWCTIGGRLRHSESLQSAIQRQLAESLGNHVKLKKVLNDGEPAFVAQYAPSNFPVDGFEGIDPRKHAIGLTYCVWIDGVLTPQNEAMDFHWFKKNNLPDTSEIGFGQGEVIVKCLNKIINSNQLSVP